MVPDIKLLNCFGETRQPTTEREATSWSRQTASSSDGKSVGKSSYWVIWVDNTATKANAYKQENPTVL